MRDARILQAAFGAPWAIHEEKGRVLLAVLQAHMFGLERVRPVGFNEEREARTASRAAVAAPANIGVLPLHGVMMPRGSFLNDGSGSLSLEGARSAFQQMEADPSIDAIVLDIDSPGGQVFSVPEFAAEIRAARKTVVAQAWDWVASAAYWIASSASRFAVSPSGMVGSIGVFEIHVDASEFYKQEGIKPTLIKAGKYKAEMNDLGPITEEALSYEQGQVDAYYTMFVRGVAKGRKASVETVRETFGQGRMVMADEAVRLGMADEVATFDETVAKLGREIQAKKRGLAAIENDRMRARTAVAEYELLAMELEHMKAA